MTRATGRTVRDRIEERMASGQRGAVAVIDFSRVGLLDFSCADEIVATLMRRCCAGMSSEHYLLFDGITDAHLDAIEHVLQHHRLALVVRFTDLGGHRLVGMVDESERVVWEAVARGQRVTATEVAAETGLSEEDAVIHLLALHRRRLVMRDGPVFRAPLGAIA
ncbi:MAG TPA: hypothetical protein VJR92_12530 [Gemmatimonadaceae bacterium]|nr:hypothetical protein [Gemmatimonadaceae bacterium]